MSNGFRYNLMINYYLLDFVDFLY